MEEASPQQLLTDQHLGSPGLPHVRVAGLGGGHSASACAGVSRLGPQPMMWHPLPPFLRQATKATLLADATVR